MFGQKTKSKVRVTLRVGKLVRCLERAGWRGYVCLVCGDSWGSDGSGAHGSRPGHIDHRQGCEVGVALRKKKKRTRS